MSANTVAQADSPQTPSTEEAASLEAHRRTTVLLAVVVATLALCLGLLNLTLYPRTWFDEGSHLHVPKALILFGLQVEPIKVCGRFGEQDGGGLVGVSYPGCGEVGDDIS